MSYLHKKIEKKWQKIWRVEKIYEPNLKTSKKHFYNLMMFPYPSSDGLHIGNMYAFVGSDIYGRLKRMQGYDVFEPIGLDGFGIHSENYALKIGKHPLNQAKISEKNFYKQLQGIGNGFSWSKKIETYDQKYYQTTQWIFIQMFKNGLAYRKKAQVNWCTSCLTVLADEQVVSGACERCGSIVIQKNLEQWFFKITNYADELLKNLDTIDWSKNVKTAQQCWIGKSEGALVDFMIADFGSATKFVKVFTTRPDTIFGATYIVLSPDHLLVIEQIKNAKLQNKSEVEKYIERAKNKTEQERIDEGREKTGVELKGVMAINPATKKEIPIWVSDYVLSNVGTGAIMAVPAHDQRDFEFAKKYNLAIVMVICPNYPIPTCPILDKAYTGDGYLVSSGQFNGMTSSKAKKEITNFINGKTVTQYCLRDWLISRQRYWSPPIPMIFCGACEKNNKGDVQKMPGWYAVPANQLPVKLPNIKNFRPTGTDKSPLALVEKFYKVRCPRCKTWAKRETDVSDTFLDSAWYYIGYLISSGGFTQKQNKNLFKKWLPVDMYIGGAEHSVLHLLYVRFIAMALHDFGFINFKEPFKKFRAHGLVIKDGAKMSKSKGNIIRPDEYINNYGADVLRMALMFLGPFEHGGDFRESNIAGIVRFLNRVNNLAISRNNKKNINDQALLPIIHKTIKKVTQDIEELQYNTAISSLMILLNEFDNHKHLVSLKYLQIFLKLLAPFAPHLSEELYQQTLASKKFKSIHKENWPTYNPKLLIEKITTLIIQVNGKLRDTMEIGFDTKESELEKIALSSLKIQALLQGAVPKRIFTVKNNLINLVL